MLGLAVDDDVFGSAIFFLIIIHNIVKLKNHKTWII